MTYNNSYEDNSIFTEKTMSDSCNGSKCIVSCSCNSANGWYDTPSSYSARAASAYGSITKTSLRTYADLGNKTKSCTHNCSCSTSSSTSCPTGYSTGTTSCASGKYFVSTSCTTTTTYACSPSGCSYNNTYTYPKGGKCNNCTYSETVSAISCPAGYSTDTTSCTTGKTLKKANGTKTITYTKDQNVSTCPAKTSTTQTITNACGKCEDEYFTAKVTICLDVQDRTRNPWHNYVGENLHYKAEGKYYGYVDGLAYDDPDDPGHMNCETDTITFNNNPPKIEFSYMPDISNLAEGMLPPNITWCEEQDGEYSTSGLRIISEKERGAYRDFVYEVQPGWGRDGSNEANITVIYRCHISGTPDYPHG